MAKKRASLYVLKEKLTLMGHKESPPALSVGEVEWTAVWNETELVCGF